MVRGQERTPAPERGTSQPPTRRLRARRVALPLARRTAAEPVPAGDFGEWLRATRDAREQGRDVAVPCGECTACCRSSLFIHIAPEERDALAHIPADLLFPAAGAPPGHVLMGYDRSGRCPMLSSSGCSIYEQRPRTCRNLDCRTVAATAVALDRAQHAIAEQARRWRFEHPLPEDDATRGHPRRGSVPGRARPQVAVSCLAQPPAAAGTVGHPCLRGVLSAGGARPSDAELASAILSANRSPRGRCGCCVGRHSSNFGQASVPRPTVECTAGGCFARRL